MVRAMIENMKGNKRAIHILNRYIEKRFQANLTLYGPKGVGKYTAARKLASSILDCAENQLDIHPDALIISEAEALKVDTVSEILEFSSLLPVRGKNKVIIIDNAESMSEIIQNKLLKIVEENKSNIFIFVTSKPLLGTIHSRTFNIQFSSLTDKELEDYLEEKQEKTELPISLYGGSIGRYELLKKDEATSFASSMKKVLSTLETMSEKHEILSAFSELKEKDNQEFFSLQKENVDLAICFLKEVFFELYMLKTYGRKSTSIDLSRLDELYSLDEAEKIFNKAKEHQKSCMDVRYTKNDFFMLIASMAF